MPTQETPASLQSRTSQRHNARGLWASAAPSGLQLDMPAKRRRNSVADEDVLSTTPKKLRFGEAVHTPTKKTPTKSALMQRDVIGGAARGEQRPDNDVSTPKSAKGKAKGKAAFTTPVKQSIEVDQERDGDTIVVVRNADRSARRKTNRKLMERTIAGDLSDEEQDTLAQQIWDGDEAPEGADTDAEEAEERPEGGQTVDEQIVDPATPSKRGRGRPKGSKNRPTPTPPPDMPPHERYFFQNRPSASKSSSNTISSFTLLSHSAYNESISAYKDRHASSIASLHGLHASSFPLWAFELSQGFTLCLYGYGAKGRLLTSFADYLHTQNPASSAPPITIIVNGHHPSLTLRSVLATVATSLQLSAASLPTSVPNLLAHVTSHLSSLASTAHPPTIYLLLSTLTARVLTTNPGPAVLSTLATHPAVRTVLTASTPTFPLLWPSAARDALNLVFHDATTFQAYDDPRGPPELPASAVDAVAELLGKKGSEAVGRERVSWVLKSLPENARGLYRILVSEILASADESGIGRSGGGGGDEEEDGYASEGGGGGGGGGGGFGLGNGRQAPNTTDLPGIDSKLLYQKASEEFLCSSEMAFRGLLREFVDHAMVVVRSEEGGGGGGGGSGGGGRGGEILGVEMGREELEGVLEDLVG